MMLKMGICSIGFSFGLALFVSRAEGMPAIVFLLVLGMVLVQASPRLRTDDDDTEALPGPEGTIRRSEPGVRPPTVRGRHSKEEAALDDSNVTPFEPRN